MPRSRRLYKWYTPVTVPPKRRGGKRRQGEYAEPSLSEDFHVIIMDNGLESFQCCDIEKVTKRELAAREREATRAKATKKRANKKTR